MILLSLAIVLVVIAIWVVGGRAWLKDKPWAWSKWWFALIEPFEITFYRKSETILKARTMQVTGLLLSALTALGQIDLSLFVPFLPEGWAWVSLLTPIIPLLISVVGWMDEQMRKDTKTPLEIVELPDDKSALPAPVIEAVAQAEATKEIAVAAVKEAEGIV